MSSAEQSQPTTFTYTPISREESEQLGPEWRHCAHLMLYAALPPDVFLFNDKHNPIKTTVMMQMRFDGRLGFPGGFIDDEDASLEAGLQRELLEEMGELPNDFEVQSKDYMFTYQFEERKYCLHFFCKKVTFDDFKLIERRPEEEPFEGFEVLGVIRVPLYSFSTSRGGFAAFLKNNFIGCARKQLLDCIRVKELLSEKELDQYIQNSRISDPLSNPYTSP
ncbi:U8 snoRNA-decapping enzyme-like [Clytia hemisphaerica]|uniref:U8 snoRNA-decapping enzyme-like n=1 Tax=Clytia hemisphaerica TaxID=252671 RepID=UPI0034D6C19F